MIVRTLQEKDIPFVIQMAKGFQENSIYKDCGFDEQKVTRLLEDCINPYRSYFMVVGEVDGKINGAFCGMVFEFYFSTKRRANDLALYVDPEDRRFVLKFLNKALELFEIWAKEWKAEEICISPSTGDYGKTLEKYLLRKAYKSVGFMVTKGLKDV